MKILFTLTQAFNPNDGGVQRTTWKLGRYFTEKGYDVSYYSLDNNGHVIPDFGKLYYPPDQAKNKNPRNLEHLRKTITQIEPDIVINQMPYEKELRNLLFELRKITGYQLLGCLRNSLFSFKSNARDIMYQQLPDPVFNMMDNPIGRWVVQQRHRWKHARDLKAIIDQHDHFILLSPPNQKELEYFVGEYKPEKITFIPNSIPEVKNIEILNEKEKIILHVGRINVGQKRSDLLLEFWNNLYEYVPDWKYIIVGDGPYLNELRGDLINRKLPRISLEGYQKPESYYKRASIFMMPSAYEGFPNTLLEAQSFGCVPVLFNSYGALEWIVHDRQDAFLIPPFDTRKMAETALDLIRNEPKRTSYQKKALENTSRFTIDRVGEQWKELFAKIRPQ